MSEEYHKIPGPFLRDSATGKLTNRWSSSELEALAYAPIWNATEKVDGTNIRVEWDGHRVTFAGRTDRAEIPKPLLDYLESALGGEDNETLFEQKFGSTPVTIYGEGYGPKIQSGGKYRTDVSFVVFDVKIAGFWLNRDSVEDISAYFRLDAVPLALEGQPLHAAIRLVESGYTSDWGPFWAEGLVATTNIGLLDRRGQRIIVKIKHRDLFEETN